MNGRDEARREVGRGQVWRAKRGAALQRLTIYAAPDLARAFHVRCIEGATTMSAEVERMIEAWLADDGRE